MALMDRDTFVARSRLWILTCRIINENREVQGPLVTEAMAETPSGASWWHLDVDPSLLSFWTSALGILLLRGMDCHLA